MRDATDVIADIVDTTILSVKSILGRRCRWAALRKQAADDAIRFERLAALLSLSNKLYYFYWVRDAAGILAASEISRRCDNWDREACRKIGNLLGIYAAYVTSRRCDRPQSNLDLWRAWKAG